MNKVDMIKFNKVHVKILTTSEKLKTHDDALYEAIESFFNISGDLQPTTEENKKIIRGLDAVQKYELLEELIGEIINMDICGFMTDSVNPKLANKFNYELNNIISKNKLI